MTGPGTEKEPPHTLANARIEVIDGYPALLVEINGIPTRISWEQKPTLTALELIYLGREWVDRLPVRWFRNTELLGFTHDPRIFALFTAFEERISLAADPTGPLTIPE